MSSDSYPAIREFCEYWRDMPMLQQTFSSLEESFLAGNDACIDAAKCLVEVACKIIVDELDAPELSLKPKGQNPAFGDWVSAAVRVLKLGDDRNSPFARLVSQHHKLTTTLGDLRNSAGPVSHGKDAFLERLSAYHRRSAVISADAIVAFLHQGYLETELNLVRTREPYERFTSKNELIDKWCAYSAVDIEEGLLRVEMALPEDAGIIILDVLPSQLLFQLDRPAYLEALNSSCSAESRRDISGVAS